LAIDVPADITTDNDAGAAGAVVIFAAPTTTGGVPPVDVSCDHMSGEFYPIGITTVTCTATDGDVGDQAVRFVEASVTDSFTITVVDAEPPVIATPPNLSRTSTTGNPIVVTFVTPAATDNAGTPTVTCAPASGTGFKVGVTTVTCTAKDGAGNTATASFTVTVTSPASGVPATGTNPRPMLLTATLLILLGSVCLGWRRRPRAI
jgi:hypothetical protein